MGTSRRNDGLSGRERAAIKKAERLKDPGYKPPDVKKNIREWTQRKKQQEAEAELARQRESPEPAPKLTMDIRPPPAPVEPVKSKTFQQVAPQENRGESATKPKDPKQPPGWRDTWRPYETTWKCQSERRQQEREEREAQLAMDSDQVTALASGGFVQFLTNLGRTLSPAQRVLCLVCFDGWQPEQFDDEDRALFKVMFGDIYHVPPEMLRWLTWVIGGRSGKSWLGTMALVWRSLVCDLSALAPGEEATALIVSPELRLARHALKFAVGVFESQPMLQRMIVSKNSDTLRVKRADGNVVIFEALPASHGGGSVRARTLIGALLDEVAFFRDDGYVVNDRDIYQAVSPRVTIPGGFTLCSSTPWSEAGLLWEEHRENWGHPTTGVCAHVSTELMRADNDVIQTEIAHARRKDPRNAAREFDAIFGAADSGAFFPADVVKPVTAVGQLIIPILNPCKPLVIVDASLSQNSDDRFGWAVLTSAADPYDRRANGETRERRLVTVHECDAWEVDRGPREMAQRLRDEVCRRYGVTRIIIDQYSDVAFAQLCSDVGLVCEVIRWTGGDGEESKAERYRRSRTAMQAKQVLLCESPRLSQDLASCRSRLLPGGGESIGVPRTRRGHGDVLSAVILGISESLVNPGRFAPDQISPEQLEAQRERERFRAAQRRAKERHVGYEWRR